MNMKLFLVEDELEHVEKIQNAMNEFAEFNSGNGDSWHFTVEYLPGEGEKTVIDGRDFQFYNDKVFEQIQRIIDNPNRSEQVGLLLDIVLTRDEWNSKYKGNYPILTLAPEIYREFQGKLPIYIITTVSAFYTNSERIMGVNLSDRFVDKSVLTELKLEAAAQKLQNFFVNWQEGDVQLAAQK